MDRVKTARWTLRAIGALLLLVSLLMLPVIFLGSPGEIGFGLANIAVYGGMGVGLIRLKESAWIVIMMVAGATGALQLAMLLAARDVMLLLSLALNVLTIVALIWAGRQLPEPQASSTAAMETPA